MRNAVVPFVSPNNYDFGNINYEVQIFNDTFQNSISGFCLDAKQLENNDNKQQTVENCPFPFHSPFITNHAQAFPTSTSILSCDVDNAASSHQLLGKIMTPQLEVDFPTTTRSARKRPMEVNDIGELLGDCTTVGLDDQWGRNKRRKVANSDQQWKNQHHKLQVPVRKSQKLADKITALQKLVSPYGKTDTASVLQEASLYIKLLQDQIQNLFRMLSSSCDGVRVPYSQEIGTRQLDLSSKGLCLVPKSLTQKMKFDKQIDHKYQRY